MEVQVSPYRVLDVITKQERDGNQYRILIDGRLAGFISYHDGAAPRMHERFSPMELHQIEAQVRIQLTPQRIGPIKQPGVHKTPPKPTVNAGDFT